MEELKPCPFCGRKSKHNVFRIDYREPGEAVFCSNFRCRAVGPERQTEKGAIKAWNRRVE